MFPDTVINIIFEFKKTSTKRSVDIIQYDTIGYRATRQQHTAMESSSVKGAPQGAPVEKVFVVSK